MIKSLLLLAPLALASLAHAKVECRIDTATAESPRNYDHKIFTTTVVENPSENPMDRSRSRYIAVKPDLSAALPIDSAKVDQQNVINDENAQPGDTIVWVQRLIKGDYYSVNVSTLDANHHIDEMWEGSGAATIPTGKELWVLVPKKGISVMCTRSK